MALLVPGVLLPARCVCGLQPLEAQLAAAITLYLVMETSKHLERGALITLRTAAAAATHPAADVVGARDFVEGLLASEQHHRCSSRDCNVSSMLTMPDARLHECCARTVTGTLSLVVMTDGFAR